MRGTRSQTKSFREDTRKEEILLEERCVPQIFFSYLVQFAARKCEGSFHSQSRQSWSGDVNVFVWLGQHNARHESWWVNLEIKRSETIRSREDKEKWREKCREKGQREMWGFWFVWVSFGHKINSELELQLLLQVMFAHQGCRFWESHLWREKRD